MYRILFITAVCSAFLFACNKRTTSYGDGMLASQKRNLAPFNSIEMSGNFAVVYQRSDSISARVVIDQNLLGNLHTVVTQDSLLKLTLDGNLKPSRVPIVYLSGPYFRSVTVSGMGSLTSLDTLRNNHLKVSVNGSGDVTLALRGLQSATAELTGMGAINLSGGCDSLEATINGSGDINTGALKTIRADMAINGSGREYVWATNRLRIRINGSGEVFYKGSAVRDTEIIGSGTIVPF
jgi:hypothetical protein